MILFQFKNSVYFFEQLQTTITPIKGKTTTFHIDNKNVDYRNLLSLLSPL
jgi:hypothetical protein